MKKLYRKMKMGERGFTLIELLVVVAILGILATLAIPRVMTSLDKAKQARDDSAVAMVQAAVERYYFDTGKWPTNDGNKPGVIAKDKLSPDYIIKWPKDNNEEYRFQLDDDGIVSIVR